MRDGEGPGGGGGGGGGGNQVDLIRKHAPSLDDLQMRESAGMEGSCWMGALTRSGALATLSQGNRNGHDPGGGKEGFWIKRKVFSS